MWYSKFFLGLTKLSTRFVWLHQVSFFFPYSRIECKAIPMCRTEEWAKHCWPTISSQNLQQQYFLLSLNCNHGKKFVKRHTINKIINQHPIAVSTEDIICPQNGRKNFVFIAKTFFYFDFQRVCFRRNC